MALTLRLPVLPNEPGVMFELPAEAMARLGTAKRPAVRVTVNGFEHHTRVAVYGGRFYVAFRRDVRAAAHLDPGEEVELTLEVESEPRTLDLPDDFADVLESDPEAHARYDALSFTHRKEYLDWLQSAKQAETRQRRLADATTLLKSGRKTPLGPNSP